MTSSSGSPNVNETTATGSRSSSASFASQSSSSYARRADLQALGLQSPAT